jgi:hypothetical protein
VPILALVENMASFRCDGCEARHYPFGKGHLDAVQASVDAGGSRPVASFSLPIVSNSGGTAEETRPSSRCPSMAETLDALAASLESSTRPAAGAAAVTLPLGLKSHELPHWPTEFSCAELAR